MRIVISEFVSLDGVVQAPGGIDPPEGARGTGRINAIVPADSSGERWLI